MRCPNCGSLDTQVKDRKSTRLNSSHGSISYAVFCLKKKKTVYIQLFLLKKEQLLTSRHHSIIDNCFSVTIEELIINFLVRRFFQCHFFFFNGTATTEIYTLSLHDALPISRAAAASPGWSRRSPTSSPSRCRKRS